MSCIQLIFTHLHSLQSHVSTGRYEFIQLYVDPKPRSNVLEVNKISRPNVMNMRVRVSIELTSQRESVSQHVFCHSCPVTPDPFGNRGPMPEAQVIVFVVDCVDTLLFAKPIRQRATTQTLPI